MASSSRSSTSRPECRSSDRLSGPACAAVGHGRCPVHAGLADHEPPALLERRQGQHPGPSRSRACAPRRRGPSNTTRVLGARGGGVRVQLAPPTSRRRRRRARGPGSRRAAPATASIACSTCLCGTSRPTTRCVGCGGLGRHRPGAGSVPLCTTAMRGRVDAELDAARRGSRARPRRTGSAGRGAAPAGARSTSRPGRSGRGRRPATARGARGGPARRPACGSTSRVKNGRPFWTSTTTSTSAEVDRQQRDERPRGRRPAWCRAARTGRRRRPRRAGRRRARRRRW